MKEIELNIPITDENNLRKLKAGDTVLLTGYMYTARDQAHKRLVDLINQNQELPISLKNEFIYYVGPAPAKDGYPIGPAGPTTSYRMDPYTPALIEKGLKGMVGKGTRSLEVIESIKKNKCVYLAAVGGAAALISKSIKTCEIILYEDLKTEAIRRLKVEKFPAIVVIDSNGNNLYETEVQKYRK
ncbi:Fe-S-containing hydro-lyase [Peptostreptococcaceae bacterium AGR-M142]